LGRCGVNALSGFIRVSPWGGVSKRILPDGKSRFRARQRREMGMPLGKGFRAGRKTPWRGQAMGTENGIRHVQLSVSRWFCEFPSRRKRSPARSHRHSDRHEEQGKAFSSGPHGQRCGGRGTCIRLRRDSRQRHEIAYARFNFCSLQNTLRTSDNPSPCD